MKSYILIGTVLTLAGVGCFGAGAAILHETLDRRAVQSTMLARSERACREQVVKIGKVTPGVDDTIEVDVPDVTDPRGALGQATSILAMCPSKQIASMCLGTKCTRGSGSLGGSVHMVVNLKGLK